MINERKRQQREDTPSLLAIDSQPVKIMQFIDEETGIDANKKINGRKRSIVVDRLGLPWSIAVSAANVSDNEAGRLVGGSFTKQSAAFGSYCCQSWLQSQFH